MPLKLTTQEWQSRSSEAFRVIRKEADYVIVVPAQRRGLGDMVAAGLSAVGVTPERVSAVTGKPCGCKKRQEALNALGRRLGIG